MFTIRNAETPRHMAGQLARLALILSLALAILGLGLALPALPALAAPAPAPVLVTAAQLQTNHQNELNWLQYQSGHLTRARQLAVLMQTYVNAQNSANKNYGDLVAALANYNAQLASAQSADNAAAGILQTDAGFDANGNVTNFVLAHQTVRTARQSLWDCHRTLRQAAFDVSVAIHNYRQANPGS